MTQFNPDGDMTQQLELMLNEGLEFNDNFRGALLEEDLTDGENQIQHGLGFVPSGCIVIFKEVEGDIFGARLEEWTNEILFLQSSVANQKVRLLVM